MKQCDFDLQYELPNSNNPTKKHAYLIMAHNEPEVLSTLIRLLDDPRNDIFLHIDSKSDIDKFSFNCTKSHLYLVPRISVLWGDFSLIQCELSLFSFARDKGPYAVYHLISGVDLPLKSQDYIHSYFDSHQGENMLSIQDNDANFKEARKRTSYYWLFPRRGKIPFLHYLACAFVFFQRVVGIKRNQEIIFHKGDEWCSLSDDFVIEILSNREWIETVFKMTNCGDELYKQTLFMKSSSKFKLCTDLKGTPISGRYTDWNGCKSSPRTLCEEHYDRLVETEALFARKFSSNNPVIIDSLIRYISSVS